MLHEILAFSSREALFNRLSALFFMTASVSFYQAFFFPAAIQSPLWLALESDLVLTWKVKTTNDENEMLASKKGVETVHVCRADRVWFHAVYPPRDYWKHTGITGMGSSTPDPQDSQNLEEMQRRPAVCCCPASSTWPQDFHL